MFGRLMSLTSGSQRICILVRVCKVKAVLGPDPAVGSWLPPSSMVSSFLLDLLDIVPGDSSEAWRLTLTGSEAAS
jgi:hypothetical protein